MTASPSIPLLWVDAFCDGPFSGNPAAVCLLDEPAPDQGMQALAAELSLSETAFVWPAAEGYSLRWFTPTSEVDLCGHATMAAARALSDWGRLVGAEPVRFHTRSGALQATVAGARVELDLPADTPRPVEVPETLAGRWPIVACAAGSTDLVAVLPDPDAVAAIDVARDGVLEAVARLPYRGVITTALATAPATVDYVLRFFAPSVGVPEDPVTGSAQCLLGPYWGGRLGRGQLRGAQLSARGGSFDVRLEGAQVKVTGSAETVLAGEVTGAAASLVLGDAR